MTDAEKPFVREAVRSVQEQTVDTPLILCVRDDNTWIEQALTDLRPVHLLRMPLAPLGDVRNRAIEEVGTEYVAFLDGDDAWFADKVRRQVDLMERHGFDLIGAKHVLIREDSKPYFYAFARDIPMPSSWMGTTAVFRERPFKSVHIGEDVELWREFEESRRVGIAEVFLLRYRVRRGSLSQHTPSMRRKLQYEARSHVPGMRLVLLAVSRLVNVVLRLKSGRGQPGGAGAVRVT